MIVYLIDEFCIDFITKLNDGVRPLIPPPDTTHWFITTQGEPNRIVDTVELNELLTADDCPSLVTFWKHRYI